jgi:hypothetical protein
MTKIWQIYFNTMLGAIGGLIGWLIVGLIPTGEWNVHLANAVSGLGVGMFIGGSIGAMEGIFIKRSILRTFLGVLGGTIAGAISGLLGLLLGGIAFVLIGGLNIPILTDPLFGRFTLGGFIGRIIGWISLGLFLGLGQGILSLKVKRASYSLLGGTVAGLLGGLIYEVLTQVFLSNSGDAQVILSAVGIVLIGSCLGGIIAATVELAKDGMVIVLTGRRANTEVSVIGKAIIGSSDACDVYVPDEGVYKQHALIQKSGSGFTIENISPDKPFQVGQKPVNPGENTSLTDGALIFLGAAQLKFKMR